MAERQADQELTCRCGHPQSKHSRDVGCLAAAAIGYCSCLKFKLKVVIRAVAL